MARPASSSTTRTGPAADGGFTESSRVGSSVGRVRLVATLLVAAVAVVAPATHAAVGPKLRLVSQQPLVVRGEGFRPAERVIVTALTATGPKRVVVRATAKGRFGATFRLPNQPCGKAFAVRAVRRAGEPGDARACPAQPCVPPPID